MIMLHNYNDISKAIFVSDAHIKFNESLEDKVRREKFLKFLQTLKNNTDLLLLNGDIFDLWISWKHVIIKEYFDLLKILRDLKENGTQIVMTPGNHDFWLDGYLSDQIGIEICKSDFCGTINGKKFYMDHGDRYTKNDIRYHIFRFLVRTRFIKKLAALLHPDLVLDLGILLSRSSRNRRIPEKRQRNMINSLEEAAQKILDSTDYDFVIFSHSHVPKVIEFSSGTYANPGDWIVHSSYLEYSQGEIKIKEYILNTIKE
jgi:UDP-2,3-diacylglucosamine hydrolase